jgi:hypothetical protein
MIGVVRGDQPRDVDQQVTRGGLAGERMYWHGELLAKATYRRFYTLMAVHAKWGTAASALDVHPGRRYHGST